MPMFLCLSALSVWLARDTIEMFCFGADGAQMDPYIYLPELRMVFESISRHLAANQRTTADN